ncbi:MAG: trpS, partial [Bacteroidetes bacterium]|nr:trpS [Bacteroidota bacterium]
RDCRSCALGCVDCKMRIANRVTDVLVPFREKRAHYESHINEVKDTLVDGETRARDRAEATMSQVHQAMSLG